MESTGSEMSKVIDDQRQAIAGLREAVLSAREGKVTRTDKYVHRSVLDQAMSERHATTVLDQVWERATEGCQEWNVLRVSKTHSHISMLRYPHFETTGHPQLELSLKVDLESGELVLTDFRSRANRPILHRKETLVAETHRLRNRFLSLTAREEELGLLLEGHKVGLARQWQSRLAKHGVEIRGHQVIRVLGRSDKGDV